MRRLVVALAFLTRLPLPRIAWRDDDVASAVRLYPAAGLVVGAVVGGIGWAGRRLDSWLGALAALVAWTWVTGALHLDGLADLADGLGAAHGDRNRLLVAMTDPQIGSFGVVAVALQMTAKLVTLHLLLPAHWAAVVAIPAVARFGPLVWSRALPPLKPTGLGAAIAGVVRPREIAGWTAVLAAACLAVGPLVAAPLLLIGSTAWFRRRVGGMTGDVHGAGIELMESGLLLVASVSYLASA